MHPSPDQAKQRALAWALYLVSGQQINLEIAIERLKGSAPRSVIDSLRTSVARLRQTEVDIRSELSKMIHRSLKGL